jgi:hypothetical protein
VVKIGRFIYGLELPSIMIGQAYGFFYCRESKDAIETELPTIREVTNVPSRLELSLIEGVEKLRGDSRLMEIAQQEKSEGMRYILEAKCSDITNKGAADEIATILNQAYQSPLYNKGEPFRGEVIFEQNGEYFVRD